jgi:hypothetical protein
MRTFFLLLFLTFSSLHAKSGAVTYEYENGRLGDNLLNYLHAKWIAIHKDIPLLYKPFPYSDRLVLSEKEIHYHDKKTRKSRGLKDLIKAPIKYQQILSKIPFLRFCYLSPYFPEDPWERTHRKFHTYYVNWKDPEFRKIAKEMIAPKETLKLTKPPAGPISIALHIREGGGFDTLDAKLHFPMKFPPREFYLNGLKRALALFPTKQIYCYLFTDSQNPAQLAAELLEALPSDAPIQFDFRKEENKHDANVLEDFFSLFEFDILIRSQSNFSMLPSLLHDYAMVYAPKDCAVQDEKVQITEIEIVLNTPLCERLAL